MAYILTQKLNKQMVRQSIKLRYHLKLALFFAVVALFYTWPIFSRVNNWGIQDWDQHLFYHGVPRLTLLEYGQFPLWNPYYVGGTVMLANPQSRLLSPFFPVHLLFGEVIGIKLEIWAHLVVGLLGIYALARYYQLNRPASLLAAFVFMLSSMYALTLSVGMTWYLSVVYLPWAFLFYLKAWGNLRYALITGVFLALMFFSGGAYPLAVTLLFFGMYGFFQFVFREHTFWRWIKVLGLTLIFMMGFGAVKFFPTIEFQQTHPRHIYDYSGYSLNSLRFALFNRDQTLKAITALPIEQPGFVNGVTGGMDENGAYIGLIPFVLFILGIGLNDKRRMILFLCFLIFLWISFGNRPKAELWTYLHLLPVYDSMRVAQRFRIVVMLCLAIFAGFGLQTVQHYLSKQITNPALVKFIIVAIPAFILIDLILVSRPILADAFAIPPLSVTRSEEFYQIWDLPPYDKNGWITTSPDEEANPFAAYNPYHIYSTYGALYPAFLSNVGTVNGYETANVPRNAVPISDSAYRGEVYLKDTTGSATISSWSPNRLVLDVDVLDAGLAVLNQNYYAGWHLEGMDRQVENVDQRLAVRVFPGDEQITIYYWPASFSLGIVVTVATILLSGGVLVWHVKAGPAPAQSPAA